MPIPKSLFGDDEDFSLDNILDEDEYLAPPSRVLPSHKPITPAKDVNDVFSTVDFTDDNPMEDSFSDIDPWADIEQPPAPSSPPQQQPAPTPDVAPPARARRVEQPQKPAKKRKKGSGDFVDEKNMKLKPFGKRNGKRAEKVGEFDPRKNMKDKARIVQFGVLGSLGLLVLFGAYKTFAPADTLTPDDVAAVAMSVNGETGFPTNGGEAYARGYLDAYLKADGSAQSVARIAKYGAELGPGLSDNQSRGTIIYGPQMSSVKKYGPESAQYTFEVGIMPQAASEEAVPEIHWAKYAINVYYNSEGNYFKIASTPAILPSSNNGIEGSLPSGANLSVDGVTGPDKELSAKVSNTISQYLTEYAKASAGNTNSLEQYLIPDPPSELLDGLGGKFTIADDVVVEAWDKGGGTVDTTALVTLVSPPEEGSIRTMSKYAITLQESGGKYLVSSIAALGYAPAPDPEAS